jgi:hypothetical protein
VELYIEDLSEEELVAYTQAKSESPILGTFEVIHA